MASIKIFSLGGLDKKSNDLTRAPEKASDMMNMEYDTQSTLKKRNGYEQFSPLACTDMVYYNSKDEILLFSEGSNQIQILNSDGSEKVYNGSTYIDLPAGIPSLADVSISYCENQNNLYFTNTDYSTYVMKYDGSNVYRAGLPVPRYGNTSTQIEEVPSFTNKVDGYTRMFYSYKDINGNITYSPFVQYPNKLGATSVLSINSFAYDSICQENGFFNKYCYILNLISQLPLTSSNRKIIVTRHNYVVGDKFLMDTESNAIGISPSDKTFIVLDVESVQNNETTASFTASSSGTTLTVTAISSGTIAIGSKITGSGVADGTYITAFIGGSGGTGTYTISISQNLTSRSMTQKTSSITFTQSSIDVFTINIYYIIPSIGSTPLELPLDVRSKLYLANSSLSDSNYKIYAVYVLDNSLAVNVIQPTKVEYAIIKSWPVNINFEDIYDSGTLKIMPPICKYIASFNNQIVYSSIQSFFTLSSSLENTPNKRVNYANDDLICYSDISTGDGPENVSELNLVKIGETWDGYITGAKRCNDSMIIFKNRGVFSIDGSLIDGEFQLRKINTNFAGCTSHKSILEADEGLYFQAHNGLYFTNGIGVKKLTYEIDSVFLSQEYTTTRSVRLKKKQKSLFYVPELSKIVVFDYYYNQVYFWNAIVAANGFIETSTGDVLFSNGDSIYKFNDGYSDNGSAINSYYSTTWHHAGEPSLNKKFLSLRTFALSDDIFDLKIDTYGDWNSSKLLTSNTLNFGSGDQTKFLMLDMQTKRSLKIKFSNSNDNENLVLTGYELNYEVFNSVDKN